VTTTEPAAPTDRGGIVDATAAHESPVFIDSAAGELFGVVTEPPDGDPGVGILMVRGSGWRPSSGPRRTQARTCRRLAGHGFRTLRLSYHGIAESGGESDDVFRLDKPYTVDIDAGIDFLAAQGTPSVLVGNCFGGRSSLAAAAGRPEVLGVALLVVPVHDFEVSRRLAAKVAKQRERVRSRGLIGAVRDPARRKALLRTVRGLAQAVTGRIRALVPGAGPPWVSRTFVAQLRQVVARGTPVLFVFGDADEYGQDFLEARKGKLGRIIDRAGDRIQVVVVPGQVHGQADHRTQEAVLGAVEGWVVSTFPADGRRP
jgi:dienelactone hydrolase